MFKSKHGPQEEGKYYFAEAFYNMKAKTVCYSESERKEEAKKRLEKRLEKRENT